MKKRKTNRRLLTTVLLGLLTLVVQAQVTLVDDHYVDPKQGLEANPTNNPDWSLMQGATVKKAAKAVKGRRNAPIANATSYGLPDHVNNGASKYFRNPVANQSGNSCGITSRHSHMMAYELNAYRDKEGSLAENMLPAHFAFVPAYREDPNKENYAKYVGIPDGATFGGTNVSTIYGGPYSESSNNYGRLQGYENWHKAMFNRITDNPNFPLGAMTEEGALAWKRWLYNHNGDDSFHAGGVIGIGVASSGLDAAAIGSTTANDNAGVTGMYYLTHWGTGVDHAMVIVGYDDRIEFDLDGDGTYGSSSNHFSQNETGAWIACNSWGNWKNEGFIYVPYALASPTSTSYSSGDYSGYKAGDTNGWVGEIYKIRKDYTPIRTLKAAVAYSKRSEIQICVGISTNLSATSPDKTLVLANHNYHGDYDSNGTDAEVPMLGRWADGQLHTEAMEFGYDLTDFTDEFDRHVPLKYFLIINTKDGASGTGQIEYASIMDYELNANGIETPFADKNVSITNDGGTTTISTIVYGEEICGPDNLTLTSTTLSWDAPASSSYTPTEYYVYKDDVRIATTTSRSYDIGAATGVFHVTAGLYSNNGAISESPASNLVVTGMSSSSFITYIGDPITSTSALTSGSYVVLKCTGTRNKYVYDNGSGNAYALTVSAPEILDPDDYKYVFQVTKSGNYYRFHSINGYLPLGNTIDPRASAQDLIVEQVSGSTNLFTFTNTSYSGTYYINGGESNLVVYSLDQNCRFYIYPVHVSIPSTNTLNVTIADPGTVYANAPVQLRLEGAADIASASWTVAGTAYTGVSPVVTFTSTGSKSVSCTATDSKGNSQTVNTTITVSAAPTATANFTLSSASTTGSDRISFLSQNTLPGCTYSWSMPGAEETTATTRNASASYLSSGEKTVTLTVTDPSSNVYSHSETFTVNASAPRSRYTISPAVVVKNNPVTLTDNTLYNPTSWGWRFDSDNNRITCNTQNGTITPTKAGVYKLTFGTSNDMGSDFVEAERALIVCNSASGNGLTFGGGNQNVTASLSSALTTTWSIDFWFNPKNLDGSLQGITGSNTVSSITRNFTITSDANGIATLSVAEQKVSTDAAFYIANEWHHYAITFSSGTVKFYRDGTKVSSKSVSTTNFSNYFKNLQLGGSSASMDGSIDEFRVWNTTLSQENIRSYCVAPISASTSGLKLYWQMNQSSGNVTDATSNNVTGTRNNFNNDGDAWTDSEGVFALDFSAATNPSISDSQLNHYYDNVYSVSDEQDGNVDRSSLGMAFDGNTSTYYQSQWESGSILAEISYPHSFILKRGALHEVTAFSIVSNTTPTNTVNAPTSGSSSGRAKYVTIEESDDATNWDYVDKEVRLYDQATNNVILPWPITKEYVRFTFSEPIVNDGSYVALLINEMNFYGTAVEPVTTEVPITYVACSDSSTKSDDVKPGSNALDGDTSTFWHSEWYPSATTYPHWITVQNTDLADIDMFYFYQQHSYDGNQTGAYRAGVMNVLTSSDNSSWTTAFEGLRIPYGNTGYVKLPETINARYIKLNFTRDQSSCGDGTFLAMNEIKAYGNEGKVNVIDDTNITDNASDAVTAGSQITAEGSITSGKPYLIYYVGNGSSAYMKDTGSAYTGKSDNNPTKNAVYYFTTGGTSGTWNVQNYITGKYWGVPTANANTYIGSTTAGDWALNFQSGNNIAPSCNSHSWNRSGSNLHPWSSGTDNVNQFRIYEVAASSTALSELTSKDIAVSSTAAETVRTGQWYVMFDRGANHGYLYENSSSHTLYNTNTAPSGYAPDNAKYLVRIVGEGGNYYIQTGFGNYFGSFTASTAVPTTGLKEQLITISKIDETNGHYYLQNPSNNIVLDANACNSADATVVGYGTTAPTTTGGNNDWAFYPVELVDSWEPDVNEVYTIANSNSRGNLTYDPTVNTTYVWSSGKSGATAFNASSDNCRWVFIPTGNAREYYIYNVGAGKFAVNTAVGSGAGNAWIFSDNAAAVTLLPQGNNVYKIKAAYGRASDGTNNAFMSVSNNYTGPIINYDDEGSLFTITQVDGADESTAANAAKANLVKSQTALTAVPSSSGWYAIQIKTAGTAGFVGRYFKNADSEYTYSGRDYPLTFTGPVDIEPSMKDPTYFTYLDVTNNYWQMPNGKYLVNSGSYFPLSSATPAAITMGYDSNGSYLKGGSSYYAVTYKDGENYFVGESTTAKYLNIYPVNLTTAGLTAWTVTITNAPSTAKLSCTRSDVSGLTEVYNNGTFFLPTGTTPVSDDFALDGMLSCTVNAGSHTITAEYNPEISISSGDMAVVQGNQVTGKGNTMQALLRIKATPFSDFQPTQFTINLSGAAQVDNVKVYSTTSDQIRFAGVTPTLLGTKASPSEGSVDIDVTSTSVSAGTTLYYWITADVKSTATEWETIDASLTSISYTNAYKTANTLDDTELDLSAIGNPNGEMRIYNSQNTLWTSSKSNSQYYRIPALLKIGTNTLLAFTDDRFTSTSDLGGNHKIDVLVKKSTDGGATWGNAVTVAAGDGSTAAGYGYGDAAVAQAANGDIVCLMAAGNTSYGSGMLHIGYTKSTDGGATWSSPIDIYGDAEHLTNSHTFQSTFVSSGHGITQTIANEGRIAFPALGKIGGTTNEYVVYSDDNGATWTFTNNYGFTGADESKLLELNDGKLLMSIRCGGYNSSNVARGYNRTTDTNVENWGTQGTWSDLTANGCNSDLIYYSRGGARDVMFHTVVKSYSTHRKDLRLYMSFDQGETWEEAFQLQPGWAAYSSMQVLDNGDLAILFEDGSIGNEDANDIFDINYVTISKELIDAKMNELHPLEAVDVKIIYEDNAETTYGSWDGSKATWTSNATSGLRGLTLTKTGGSFGNYNSVTGYTDLYYYLGSGTQTLTLTAPDGFVITGYSAKLRQGQNKDASYTVTTTDGQTFSPAYAAAIGGFTDMSVSRLSTTTTDITVSNTDNSCVLCFVNFVVSVAPEPDLDNCDIKIASSPDNNLSTDKWYVMYNRGSWRGYLYDNGSNQLYHTSTEPGLVSTDSKRFLVRLSDAGEGKYYIETGRETYFQALAHSTIVTTGNTKETFTVAKINNTDGHFYIQGASNNVVMDANAINSGTTAGVVGWNTTVPTSLNGNNDWAFYPVELVEHFAPTATDIYTINNLNTSRGALTSDPTINHKFVWSSGKGGATAFNAESANCQWIFVPTATANQYCLYNVGKQKFIVPTKSGSYGGYSWMFSSDAVPLQLFLMSDGTYKINTVSGSRYLSVSNDYLGPIINYNDIGAQFTLTKQADASSAVSTQLSTALANIPAATKPITLKAVNGKSYATLYLDYDAQTDENTKAYYITGTTGSVAQLTEVDNNGRNIPAYTAVVLVNEDAETNVSFGAGFSVSNGYGSAVAESDNLLKGTLTDMELNLSDETNYYSLGKKTISGVPTIGFYKYNKSGTTTITLGANKAYLETTAAISNIKGFVFDLEDDPDAISEINGQWTMDNGESVYNLSGQRISKPQRGINIINGKKIIIK